MALKTLDEHIEITPNVLGGKPRIAGHRISVQDVAIWHEQMGQSVEQIASEYHLSIADIYAALAYYHDHHSEIDQSMQDAVALVDALRQKTPSKLNKKTHGD